MESLAAVLTLMLKDLPGVGAKRRGEHASFAVGKKVFAFTRPEGVAMKLPPEKIRELTARKEISPLVMGQRTMKEWVVLQHKKPAAYIKDLDLFRESAQFAGRD